MHHTSSSSALRAVKFRGLPDGSRRNRAFVTPRPAPLIKLDYFDMLACANLWEGRCHCLDGLGHAPFWEAPSVFTIRRCGRQVVVPELRPFDTKLDAPDSKSNRYVDSLNLEETEQLKWSAVAHSHS